MPYFQCHTDTSTENVRLIDADAFTVVVTVQFLYTERFNAASSGTKQKDLSCVRKGSGFRYNYQMHLCLRI